jgi:2-dehydropantoate 2-reductase
MRVLVLGAGALGGYFGGRLAQAGRDVTFLVRERRAAQLRARGLVIASRCGNATIPAPRLLLAGEPAPGFGVVILTCKAYDLDPAMDAIAPAVAGGAVVLPLLNGMRHLDALTARFGADAVLGGRCAIGATLDADGTIRHLNETHEIVFGEIGGGLSPRVQAIDAVMQDAGFVARASEVIVQEMWEKWVMLASLAAATCLFRGAVGDILAGGGEEAITTILAEATAIAARAGHAPRPKPAASTQAMLTKPGSTFTASMLRDMEQGGRVEADHIIGDLVARAGEMPVALLRLALVALKTYEARQAREAGGHG